uniref:Synaptotagmin n=1 Tax=Strongyloides stercoralis TaxID=6248 RepID=A0A0K0EN15_STRER
MEPFQDHEMNQLLIGFTFLSAAIAIFLAFFCYCGAKTCCKGRNKESTSTGVVTTNIKKNANEPLLTSVSYTSNIESPEIAFIDERITNVVSSTVKVNSLRSS